MRRMGITDFIDATRLSARILAMVSVSKTVSSIVTELVQEDGAHFSIRTLSEYPGLAANREVSFSEIVSVAVEFGEIAIAWWGKDGDEDPWEVNPKDKTRSRPYDATMRIACLRNSSRQT